MEPLGLDNNLVWGFGEKNRIKRETKLLKMVMPKIHKEHKGGSDLGGGSSLIWEYSVFYVNTTFPGVTL